MQAKSYNPDKYLQGKYRSKYEIYYMWGPEKYRDRS